jgi:hypothetical protein
VSSTIETDSPDLLPASWLAALWAVDPARIDAMRRAGELVAVRAPGATEWSYPAWQFEGGRPLQGIRRVVAAAREAGLDEASLYGLLTAPLGLRGDRRRRLVDLLREGRTDDAVDRVRAAG